MWHLVVNAGAFVMKRPWILAIIALVAFAGFQWVQIQALEIKVDRLGVKVEQVQSNLNTCRGNVSTLEKGIQECIGEQGNFTERIDLLEGELQGEKDLVVYWRDMYLNKQCVYDPCTDVPAVEGEVLNDENSVDAINRINDILNP